MFIVHVIIIHILIPLLFLAYAIFKDFSMNYLMWKICLSVLNVILVKCSVNDFESIF